MNQGTFSDYHVLETGTFLTSYAGGCGASASYYPNAHGRGLFSCFTDGKDGSTADDANSIKGSRLSKN